MGADRALMGAGTLEEATEKLGLSNRRNGFNPAQDFAKCRIIGFVGIDRRKRADLSGLWTFAAAA